MGLHRDRHLAGRRARQDLRDSLVRREQVGMPAPDTLSPADIAAVRMADTFAPEGTDLHTAAGLRKQVVHRFDHAVAAVGHIHAVAAAGSGNAGTAERWSRNRLELILGSRRRKAGAADNLDAGLDAGLGFGLEGGCNCHTGLPLLRIEEDLDHNRLDRGLPAPRLGLGNESWLEVILTGFDGKDEYQGKVSRRN